MAASRWRQEARRVIEAVLSALPADATLAQKRRAIRAAYPFGTRAYHPYRQWCREARLALGLPARAVRRDAKSGHVEADRLGDADADAGPTLFD